MEHPVTVKCPLPGLEAVEVTYNMAVANAPLKEWRKSFGAKGDGVILDVKGWPDDTDPFGTESPNSFRIWATNQGFASAIRDFAEDPLWLTASELSTTPTPEGS